MELKYFQIDGPGKKALVEEIKVHLSGVPNILFAYLHGSFVTGDRFRDIDIAVYLKVPVASSLQVELELEAGLARVMKRYPVEVRVLNSAPLSFRYNVVRHGQLLMAADDDLRADFVETTLSNYFDFAPFHKMYLKEVLGSEI